METNFPVPHFDSDKFAYFISNTFTLARKALFLFNYFFLFYDATLLMVVYKGAQRSPW